MSPAQGAPLNLTIPGLACASICDACLSSLILEDLPSSWTIQQSILPRSLGRQLSPSVHKLLSFETILYCGDDI